MTSSRQAVSLPQLRSLMAALGVALHSPVSVRISCSGLKKLVESKMMRSLTFTKFWNVASSSSGGSPSHQRYTGRSGLSRGCSMLPAARAALPLASKVVCSKQWRIKSEIIEKQRSVTHADTEELGSLLSSTTMATRARCVLDKSRNTLLASPAVSISGVQMTRFNTLVRTLTFAPEPVRRLSWDMLHKEVSLSSTSSMRTHFPAQGRRTLGPFAVSFAMLISHSVKELHCSPDAPCSSSRRTALFFATNRQLSAYPETPIAL